MFATRLFQLLVLAVAVLSIAQGSWWDENRLPRRAMIRRQADNESPNTPLPGPSSKPTEEETSSSTSEAVKTSSSAAEPTSSQEPPPQSSSTSSAESTTSEDPKPSSTSAPPRTSSSNEDTTTASSSSDAASTTEPPAATSSSSSKAEEDDEKSTTQSYTVSTSYSVTTKTNSDGTKETSSTTVLTTFVPELNGKDNSSSNMSSKTKNTIIGVVVGIGGAIVVGALALVAWRIWGRKKQAEENDGLMAYDTSYGGAEKSEASHSPSNSTSQRNPFQSTLENYHQPTPVNASSNF